MPCLQVRLYIYTCFAISKAFTYKCRQVLNTTLHATNVSAAIVTSGLEVHVSQTMLCYNMQQSMSLLVSNACTMLQVKSSKQSKQAERPPSARPQNACESMWLSA